MQTLSLFVLCFHVLHFVDGDNGCHCRYDENDQAKRYDLEPAAAVQDREGLESAWGDVVSRTSDCHITTARGCVEHLVDREVDQMHHAAARLLPYSILYMARRLNKLDVICID